MFSGAIVYNEESDLNGRSLRMEIIEQITAVLIGSLILATCATNGNADELLLLGQ